MAVGAVLAIKYFMRRPSTAHEPGENTPSLEVRAMKKAANCTAALLSVLISGYADQLVGVTKAVPWLATNDAVDECPVGFPPEDDWYSAFAALLIAAANGTCC